jgi:hypothetical protein
MDPSEITVKKASGVYEPFSVKKLRNSLKRAGANKKLITKVQDHVEKQLYDGITTKKIYQEVYRILGQLDHSLALRYNLKEAIMALGPSGYPFENFVAGVLDRHGYQTKTNQIIRGHCISHEIDVTARKDNTSWMIECKFHNRPGTKSKIKEALYTHARFLDVTQTGKFDQGWLITNTKVTSQAIDYALCVNLQILSWDYPPNESLRYLIEKSNLHPVTCLAGLDDNERRQILLSDIVFCHDLVMKKNEHKLPPALFEKARNEAQILFDQTLRD